MSERSSNNAFACGVPRGVGLAGNLAFNLRANEADPRIHPCFMALNGDSGGRSTSIIKPSSDPGRGAHAADARLPYARHAPRIAAPCLPRGWEPGADQEMEVISHQYEADDFPLGPGD